MINEGFYWVRAHGKIQIAFFVKSEVKDFETGKVVEGYWQFNGHAWNELCSNDIEILSARLTPPAII